MDTENNIELTPGSDNKDRLDAEIGFETRVIVNSVPDDAVFKEEITKEVDSKKLLIYGVEDSPPIHITVVCALQQGLLSLSTQLTVSLLVADAVCASNNDMFKTRLLSSTLFMDGITTLAQTIFGIRLPLFQGASASYIIPLLLVGSLDGTFCSSSKDGDSSVAVGLNMSAVTNVSDAAIEEAQTERILTNIQAIQGSLMLAGVIHALMGFTGLIGALLHFVGPLTIVPSLLLIFIFIVKPIMKFAEASWGITASTVMIALILSLYLANHKMPIPVWTPSVGFRIIRYPLHQVFAILISILFNWMLCGILTQAGVFTDDKTDKAYQARTDARPDIISDSPWFIFPYPGQFGRFGYHNAAFLSCMIATVISILDSIGDYYACARVCRVPAPPSHAMNRGLLIEGTCTIISGAVGCGHATGTYGGNIGAIAVTGVASRQVFIFTGILYVLFGIFGKLSAVFITVPYPVLGGSIIVMLGICLGVVVSNLEVTNLSSPRNIAIIGLSVFIGLMIPTWVEKVGIPIHTGNDNTDSIVALLLGSPNLVGTVIACFLDNTVPGTKKERGIEAWQVDDDEDVSKFDLTQYDGGYEVYSPLLPERVLQWRIMKYIPFLPYRHKVKQNIG